MVRVLAVKGQTDFHLMADSSGRRCWRCARGNNASTSRSLWSARTVEDVRAISEIDTAQEQLLTENARPIVLLRKKSGTQIVDEVAPTSA